MSGGGGSNAGAVRAGGAFVELFTRDNMLYRGLDAARKKVAATAAEIARATAVAAGTLATTTAAALAKSAGTLSEVARVGEIAKATGAPVASMSGLLGVMEQAGSGIKESIESITQFGTAITNAVEGKGEQAQELFAMLNRSAAEFKGVDISEGVFRLFEAIEQVNDPLAKMRALSLAFGTDGMKLLVPMLNKSSAELRQQAGLYAMTAGDVEQARQSTAAYAAASAAVSRAWRAVAVTLGPAITAVAGAVETVAGGIGRFVNANKDALSIGLKTAAFMATLELRAAGLGPTIDSLTGAWASFSQSLAAGDLSSAAAVAMAALDVEFSRGLDAMAQTAEKGANTLLSAFTLVADGIRMAFQQAFQSVGKWLNILALGADQVGLGGGSNPAVEQAERRRKLAEQELDDAVKAAQATAFGNAQKAATDLFLGADPQWEAAQAAARQARLDAARESLRAAEAEEKAARAAAQASGGLGGYLRGAGNGLQAAAGNMPNIPSVSVGGMGDAAKDRLQRAEEALRFARVRAAFRAAFPGGSTPAAAGQIAAAATAAVKSVAGGYLGGADSAKQMFGGGNVAQKSLTTQQQMLASLNEIRRLTEEQQRDREGVVLEFS